MTDFDFTEERYGEAAPILQALTAQAIATSLVLAGVLRMFPSIAAQRESIDAQLEAALLAMPVSDAMAAQIRAEARKLLT